MSEVTLYSLPRTHGITPPLNPKLDTLKPEPWTLNPKLQTPNLKPQTLNPKPYLVKQELIEAETKQFGSFEAKLDLEKLRTLALQEEQAAAAERNSKT